MAIASVGTMGTGASSTSSTTFTLTTATNSLAAGDFALLTVVSDNTATADGNTNTHTGVSGGTGTWTKLGEYTNTVGGAAADGVCTSVWKFEASGTVNTGTVITITLSAARVDKCASMWKFTKAANTTAELETGTTNPVTNGVDASNGFGSAAFSGLASASRLYYRGLGKEANSTTDITVSTSFTAITLTRSRNNASAVLLRGEFRINTSTGETSNPTLAVTGDTAGVFVALKEVAAAQNVTPTGLASSNAFGTSETKRDPRIDGAGWANAQAFGTAVLELTVTASGWANTQAWGTATVSIVTGIDVNPNGWANAQSFGTPRLDLSVLGAAFLNSQAFGTAALVVDRRIDPAAWASSQAFGTAELLLDKWLEPASLLNAQLFGVAQLHRTINGVGFVNEQAYGTTIVNVDPRIEAAGFTVTHPFGTPTVNGGAQQTSGALPTQLRAVQARLSVR